MKKTRESAKGKRKGEALNLEELEGVRGRKDEREKVVVEVWEKVFFRSITPILQNNRRYINQSKIHHPYRCILLRYDIITFNILNIDIACYRSNKF